MHSSDEEEEGERHPINAVLQAAKARKLNGRDSKASGLAAEQEPKGKATPSRDASGSPGPASDKKAPGTQSKKKKKSKKTPERQEAVQEDAQEDVDGTGAPLSPGNGAIAEADAPKQPATAPLDLTSITARVQEAGGKDIRGQPKIVFVEDQAEIVQAVELRRLTKAPRYFDDDVGMVEPSTKRCFHCGQMGHFANSCTNAARVKPCILCAQLGHEAFVCPNRLCFRCGMPGHVSKDCKNGRVEGWESAAATCNRCGSTTSCPCVGKGDYFRYEGGCTGSYTAEDLRYCRCYVCGKTGHLCCKPTPRVSCYNCGSTKHLGEECPEENRPHLAAERAGDMRKAEQEREKDLDRQQQQATRGYPAGGMHRSQSVGGAPRTHNRWDDDDQPIAVAARYNQHDNRDRYRSAPRYEAPSVAAYATHTTSRFAQPPPMYGMQQHQQQQPYNAAIGTAQRHNSIGHVREQQYSQQQQQYGQQYADRSRSVGAYQGVYGVMQQQHQHQHQQYDSTTQQAPRYAASVQPQRHGGSSGTDARVRQSSKQQQQEAQRESDAFRRQLDRQERGRDSGHKRSRYHDDDEPPASRRRY